MFLERTWNFCCFKVILQCKHGGAAAALGKSEPTKSLKSSFNINQSHSLGGFCDYCHQKYGEFAGELTSFLRSDVMRWSQEEKIIGPGFKC